MRTTKVWPRLFSALGFVEPPPSLELVEAIQPVTLIHDHCEADPISVLDARTGVVADGTIVNNTDPGGAGVVTFAGAWTGHVTLTWNIPVANFHRVRIFLGSFDVPAALDRPLGSIGFGGTGQLSGSAQLMFPKLHAHTRSFLYVQLFGATVAADLFESTVFVQPL